LLGRHRLTRTRLGLETHEPCTGMFREPSTQIDEASEHMLALSAALARTMSYAEAARHAIEYTRSFLVVGTATAQPA